MSIQIPELDGAVDFGRGELVDDMAQDIFLIRDRVGQVVIIQIISEPQSLLMAQTYRNIQPETGLRVKGLVFRIRALAVQVFNEDSHIGTGTGAGDFTLTDRASTAFKRDGFFISVHQHQTVT